MLPMPLVYDTRAMALWQDNEDSTHNMERYTTSNQHVVMAQEGDKRMRAGEIFLLTKRKDKDARQRHVIESTEPELFDMTLLTT
jgi:hypothetical protein